DRHDRSFSGHTHCIGIAGLFRWLYQAGLFNLNPAVGRGGVRVFWVQDKAQRRRMAGTQHREL
ncbi:MAG TPA: hypothetical protein VIU43_03480, partial [Nitrosospira sp.]